MAFVGLGVLILLWGLRERPEPTATSSRSQAVVGGPPSSVGVSIEARPANAEISIDGVSVPNPYVAERKRDAAKHMLRVSAPGFAPEQAELTFDTDVRIFRALSAAPPVSSVASAVVHGSSASWASRPSSLVRGVAPAPSSAPIAPASCDPPYFLDARGIKKFKPECI